MEPEWLDIGKIGKPFGRNGEVYITVLTDFPNRFKENAELSVFPPLQGHKRLVIKSIKQVKEKLVVKFMGVNNRSQAEVLRDRIIRITASEAHPLPAGSYWHYQIIGLKVLTTSGEAIGTIKDIYSTASNDVYVVSLENQDKKEFLIPATKEVIQKVDIKAKEIIINPIPGLLD